MVDNTRICQNMLHDCELGVVMELMLGNADKDVGNVRQTVYLSGFYSALCTLLVLIVEPSRTLGACVPVCFQVTYSIRPLEYCSDKRLQSIRERDCRSGGAHANTICEMFRDIFHCILVNLYLV